MRLRAGRVRRLAGDFTHVNDGLALLQASDFEIFYRRNWRYVRTALAGLGVPARDLDDLCHEVFLVALQKLPETSLEVAAERFWLRQTGYYLAAGYRRRAFRRLEIGVDEPEDFARSPDRDAAAPAEQGELLDATLSALRGHESDLVALHVVGELSFRTLGEICDCDPKTARKRFLSAVRRARSLAQDGAPSTRGDALVDTPWASRGASRPASGTFQVATHLDLRVFDESIAVGLAGRVVITHWYGAVSAATLELLLAETREIRETGGGKFGYLAIVERSSRPPGFAERAKILELLRFFRGDIAAYATVPYANSLVFPIMSALAVLARVPFPMRFLTSVDAAAAWLFETLGEGTALPNVGSLAQAASALRSHRVSRQAALGDREALRV